MIFEWVPHSPDARKYPQSHFNRSITLYNRCKIANTNKTSNQSIYDQHNKKMWIVWTPPYQFSFEIYRKLSIDLKQPDKPFKTTGKGPLPQSTPQKNRKKKKKKKTTNPLRPAKPQKNYMSIFANRLWRHSPSASHKGRSGSLCLESLSAREPRRRAGGVSFSPAKTGGVQRFLESDSM